MISSQVDIIETVRMTGLLRAWLSSILVYSNKLLTPKKPVKGPVDPFVGRHPWYYGFFWNLIFMLLQLKNYTLAQRF